MLTREVQESLGLNRTGGHFVVLKEDVGIAPVLPFDCLQPSGHLVFIIYAAAEPDVAPIGGAYEVARGLAGVGPAKGAISGTQSLKHVVLEPRRMAEFKCGGSSVAEEVQEVFEARQVDLKVGRELKEDGSQLVIQGRGSLREDSDDVICIL